MFAVIILQSPVNSPARAAYICITYMCILGGVVEVVVVVVVVIVPMALIKHKSLSS